METAKKDNNKIIGIILVVVLIAVGGLLIFRNFGSKNSSEPVAASGAISGTLDVNGVVPDGSTLVLSQQETGSGGTPTDFSTVNNPKDQEAWIFNDAVSGKTYQIRGTLKSSNGAVLSTTPSIIVSAPASNQALVVNLEGKGLTGVAEISGLVKVNGFFPSGSTVSLLSKTPNTDFAVTREGLPAQASTPVSTDKAVAGQKYDIVGYLYDQSGTKIGESSVLSLVAPAKNEVLVINSSAAAPTPAPSAAPVKSKISGNIQLNGVVPSNSRIVILQAPMNSNDFVVAVDNVPASNGQAWVWANAQAGTWYNMQAVLKQRQDNGTDKDLALSSQMTVAAPAINVQFTLNTGIAPTPSPTPAQ